VPVLSEDVYLQILRVLDDLGRQMETTPSLYSGKNEEAIRDLMLMFLNPHFEADGTAETFNKSGKTDILIRYDRHNVFAAECKFWHGEKAFAAAIDQLLGYLTWRDSRAAVVCFVKNKDMTNVLDRLDEVVPTHPLCVRAQRVLSTTSKLYRFRLPQDADREIDLGILVYHLPE
jgi:hypothetical protein